MIGDVHNLNGYVFTETMHGPNIERACVDCGRTCYSVPDWPNPRCGTCLAKHCGVVRTITRVRKPTRL